MEPRPRAVVTGEAPATDGLSNPSKRKLGRRDATGFKKLPHLDDLLLWQIAMSVPERGGMSMELHADSIAKLVVLLCPDILQEMHDLLEIDIRANRVGE
jgi:hypothetical protein